MRSLSGLLRAPLVVERERVALQEVELLGAVLVADNRDIGTVQLKHVRLGPVLRPSAEVQSRTGHVCRRRVEVVCKVQPVVSKLDRRRARIA